MPLGEIIGEVILRPIFEVVLYGLSYWIGVPILKLISLGNLQIAPAKTIGNKLKHKKKWYQIDWSIWLHQSKKHRVLKAEIACLVGTLALATTGYFIYLHSTGC